MPIDKRPIIVITIGDPAGIGPEVIVKALSNHIIYDMCRPFVIGESAAVQAAITLIQKPLILRSIEKVTDTIGKTGTIDILDMHNLDRSKVKMGIISADCGRASMGFLEKAM